MYIVITSKLLNGRIILKKELNRTYHYTEEEALEERKTIEKELKREGYLYTASGAFRKKDSWLMVTVERPVAHERR